MRTTLTLDDDVLAKARQLADASGQSLGHVISDLARTTLATRATSPSIRNGMKLLPAAAPGVVVTLDDVNRLRDEIP